MLSEVYLYFSINLNFKNDGEFACLYAQLVEIMRIVFLGENVLLLVFVYKE